MFFCFFIGCANTFLPEELLFALDDVSLSAVKPAIYIEAFIDTENDHIWEAHQHIFTIQQTGKTPFSGVIQLYRLPYPWDQSTLPPYGSIVEQYNIHVPLGAATEFVMQTPVVSDSPFLYSMLYVEGEGEITGNIIMTPTIWVQPNQEQEWTYSVMSFRY